MLNRLKDIIRAEFSARVQDNPGFKKLLTDKELDIEEILKGFSTPKYDAKDDDNDAFFFETRDESAYHSRKQTNYRRPISKEQQYYQDLELASGASFVEIKKQYRKLMKIYHPDLYHNDPEKHKIAQEVSRKINEAYVFFEKKAGNK